MIELKQNVIKRDGSWIPFDETKIINAISKANAEVPLLHQLNPEQIEAIADIVTEKLKLLNRAIEVELIQDIVEETLMENRAFEVAQLYIRYRFKRTMERKANTTDDEILTLISGQNEELNQENANKNILINSTQRDYLAGIISKDFTNRLLLPKDIVEAHKNGIIHFHDADYFIQPMHNCCLINIKDMLENGTVISGTKIDTPRSFQTACTILTQIIAQVASNQYGGQTVSLAHIAPYVDVSRQKYIKEIKKESAETGIEISDEQIAKIAEIRVKKEIKAGIQTIQYQLLTLMTTNGQAPFVTVYMYLDEVEDGQIRKDLAMLIEEVVQQRYDGIKNDKGVKITPAFPKLIYVLDEDNITEDSPYWYLTELCAKCTAKRLVPDYISAKLMRELKNGDVYGCMGCRSFLTPDITGLEPDGSHKYYGRFNQGVCSINLPYIALMSNKDENEFWKIFDKYLELCHKALRCRHERLLGTPSDVAPILWQNGALARLKPGEKIDKLLYGNYSTISLGYAGLYEAVRYMTGESHTDKNGYEFGIKVMQHMNDMCAKWRVDENISYSLYGTPMESTTYKFAKALQRDFGIIPEVTDHQYITNSYHINVREEIDAFDKLSIEAKFQALSPGGAISYIEVPNMQNNIPAVLTVLKHIYNTIMYAELNTKSDYCKVCGFEGEIQIVKDENGKLIWQCPKCGNTDHNQMSTARRVCGYIGSNDFNQGRMGDIADRVLHL